MYAQFILYVYLATASTIVFLFTLIVQVISLVHFLPSHPHRKPHIQYVTVFHFTSSYLTDDEDNGIYLSSAVYHNAWMCTSKVQHVRCYYVYCTADTPWLHMFEIVIKEECPPVAEIYQP